MKRVTKETKNRLAKGTRVYWHDPDHNAIESNCSGPGTISVLSLFDENPEVDGDTIISVEKDDGGFVEALWHELSFLGVAGEGETFWTDDDTKERLKYIEEQGYNGVGEFEVQMMLSYIEKLEARLAEIELKSQTR